MRQLSIHLFLDTLSFVEGREKRKMRKEVYRSLVPLYLHLHDEEESVAKVGIAFIWGRAMLPLCCPPSTGVLQPTAASSPAAASSLRRGSGDRGLCCCFWAAVPSQLCLAGLPESPPWCRTVPALEAAGAPGTDSTVLADWRVHGMHIPTPHDRVGTALR